jgi:outer membrane protein assembly factor BamB
MRKQALAIFMVCLCGGTLSAGLSLGRPSAVKKQVSKLDDKVHAKQPSAAVNNSPVISSLVAVSSTVATGASAAVTVTASDPDGDAVSYVCTSTAGAVSGSGAAVTWTAPAIAGVYAVSCTVSDGKGGAASQNVLVKTVAPGGSRWAFLATAVITALPAIGSDGTVYAATNDGKVYALDPADGSQKWVFATDTPSAITSSPAIGADGALYFGDGNGDLYAVTSSGVKKSGWTVNPVNIGAGPIESSPAIGADGTIYIGSDDASLYAVDPANGTVNWTFADAGDALNSSPAVGTDGTVYIGSVDNSFYAVTSAGVAKPTFAAFATLGDVHSSPAIGADGTVYFGSNDSKFFAMDPDTGLEKWGVPYNAGQPINSSPVIGVSGDIYFADDGGDLNAVTTLGAAVAGWPLAIGNPLTSPSIGADGTIYIGSDDTNFYAIDPATRANKWTFSPGVPIDSPAAIASDGTVYFGADDKRLYALCGNTALAATSWPKFRRNAKNTGR